MRGTDMQYAEYKAKLPALLDAHEAAFQRMQAARQRAQGHQYPCHCADCTTVYQMWAETDRLWAEIIRPGVVFNRVGF